MEKIKSFFSQQYAKFQRHAFQTHPRGHAMFHDLDDLISLRENFIDYIKFEYSLAIFYNLILSIPSLIYLITRFNQVVSCDVISTIWLFIVTLIKLIEVVPKGLIIYQTIRISVNSNDNVLSSRRLMYMTRSNIFYYNNLLGNSMLILYTVYFLCLRRSNTCDAAPKFYYIINWLVFGFFLRLIISFVNYFLHFKYGVNEADVGSGDMFEYQNGVSSEVLNSIEVQDLDNTNISTLIPKTDDGEIEDCAICIYPFQVGQTVRILPCDKKHIFHKKCIDKWLSHHKSCPIDRKEITKKLVNKSKIY